MYRVHIHRGYEWLTWYRVVRVVYLWIDLEKYHQVRGEVYPSRSAGGAHIRLGYVRPVDQYAPYL